MKRRYSFLWVSFVLLVSLPGCGPAGQTTQTPGSALVRVECYGTSVQAILQLIRSGRGKDINVRTDGAGTEITAAFSPAYTEPAKLAQILQQLNDLSGVVHVDVEENPHPIRQNF
jgi:hypothetical protein